jgi:hypothetical protein
VSNKREWYYYVPDGGGSPEDYETIEVHNSFNAKNVATEIHERLYNEDPQDSLDKLIVFVSSDGGVNWQKFDCLAEPDVTFSAREVHS